MATISRTVERRTAPSRRTALEERPWFDSLMTALLGWFLCGIVLDGWAHSHGKVDSSFFTPWHAVFYSGFVMAIAPLALVLAHNRGRGMTWRAAVPAGYGPALLGGAIFAFGGVFDMIWHTLFGIEQGAEALLSPSHLTLIGGMLLMLSAPLRVAWLRPTTARPRLVALIPALLSLCYCITLLAFATEYAHPYVNILAARWTDQREIAVGITGVIIQSALLIGFVLFALRRWHLPPGSLTLVLGLNALLISPLDDHYFVIVTSLIAGVLGDLLIHFLRPTLASPWRLRLFAVALPVIIFACYFGAIARLYGINWSIHVWTGTIVLGGAVGLLLSYLVLPPPVPDQVAEL